MATLLLFNKCIAGRLGPAVKTNAKRFEGVCRVCAFQRNQSQDSKSSASSKPKPLDTVNLLGKDYPTDSMTNISPRVLSKLGKNLHRKQSHPLNLLFKRIRDFFYANFTNGSGSSPSFTMFDNINPVVTTAQNFDSLLVPKDHISRSPRDSYYVNSTHLLRAHTSAHQEEIIKMGFNAFLVFGDVYRRDEIDASHYPVFHQCEGVKLFSPHELFSTVTDPVGLSLLEKGTKTKDKQEYHTMETSKLVEFHLKKTLLSLAQSLFGTDLEYRWVDCYFPFTHPSWELEIRYNDQWLEVLGSGIIEQRILTNAGAGDKVGYAFGLGLERLAMRLYSIPDIRIFWSEDDQFLKQFDVEDVNTPITYKQMSQYPKCVNDISFWTPDDFSPNDFYDLVRNVGGDVIEQVTLIDEFYNPKLSRTSHCYRIVYRHMEKTFTQEEVNELHESIANVATDTLNVVIR